ncbi:MAG: hypothetical protein K5669_03045 [Lachnospiraceae bacterium]|nr:hypothetical protein [Lachnospiraceae bacterium]
MSKRRGRGVNVLKIFIVIAVILIVAYLGMEIAPSIYDKFKGSAAPEKLAMSEEELYVKACTALLSGENTVNLGITTSEMAENIARKVYDTPEIFWLSNNYTVTVVGVNSILTFYNEYEDVDVKRQEVKNAAQEILDGLPEGGSDYEKLLYIHDTLCDRLEYFDDDSVSCHNVYGALVNGKCVCEGYAKSFAYLLNTLSYENYLFSGDAKSSDMSGPHEWNGVVVGGDCYYFDLTWDDSEEFETGYDYFGVTSAEIQKNHFFDTDYPVVYSNATGLNYHYANDLVIGEYSDEALRGMIEKSSDTIYLKCSSIVAYEKLTSSVSNPMKFMEVLSSAKPDNGYKGYMYVENDDLMTVTIVLTNDL